MSANESTSTRAGRLATGEENAWRFEIAHAKALLDTARQISDQLKIDLAEATLNDLLDRYHIYHTNRRDK